MLSSAFIFQFYLVGNIATETILFRENPHNIATSRKDCFTKQHKTTRKNYRCVRVPELLCNVELWSRSIWTRTRYLSGFKLGLNPGSGSSPDSMYLDQQHCSLKLFSNSYLSPVIEMNLHVKEYR